MNLLDLLPGQYKKCGHKNGGEFAGPCPWCGDGGKGQRSDRFHVWPDQGQHGTYWCRMCGKAGDAIKYLVDHDSMTFKEACARLGLDPAILGPKADKIPAGWQPSTATAATEVWADHAAKFAGWCHERLLERADDLAWLAGRGISIAMVKKYRLGYNPTHAWRERPAWGLSLEKKENGQNKKLWLPRGLVIPLYSASGRVERLRIRQPDQAPRYLVISGSSREPLCSRPAEAMFIVESELDAILLDGLAGDLIGVVAMGNDTAKPTAELHKILTEALVIGVALDSDQPKYNPSTGAMDMPGTKASRWWLQQYSRSQRVPMVGGKDPGDAFQAGTDLRTWVMAALPPYFHIKAEIDAEKAKAREEREQQRQQAEAMDEELRQAAAEKKACSATATGRGEKSFAPTVTAPVVTTQTTPPQPPPTTTAKEIVLTSGRSFLITDNQEEWQALTNSGRVVFSENELKRLQRACSKMDKDERLAAAMLVLDAKEVFGNAWISRGEVVCQAAAGGSP